MEKQDFIKLTAWGDYSLMINRRNIAYYTEIEHHREDGYKAVVYLLGDSRLEVLETVDEIDKKLGLTYE